MVVIKGSDLNIREEEEEGQEEVEHGLIRDSVLEMISTNFTISDDFEELPMGNIRRNAAIPEQGSGKPSSRKKYFNSFWVADGKEDEGDSDVQEEEPDSKEDEGSFEEESDIASDLAEGSEMSREEEHSLSESEIEDGDYDISPSSGDKIVQDGENEISIFSAAARDTQTDIEKGKAVRNQLSIWDQLLECRIKLQKSLIASNKLYQKGDFKNFKTRLSAEEEIALGKTYSSLVNLLEAFIELQKIMNPDMKLTKTDRYKDSANGNEENEGVPKKIRKLNEYSTSLEEIHDCMKTYKDPIIQKWNDKTRVLSGKISSTDFSAFEQSTLKQIEHILCDKSRLVKRTQLKRSCYNVLGKYSHESTSQMDGTQTEEIKKASNIDEYDPEIFDDDDFYHKLLRDFIDRKTSDITDPHQLGRQWTELQKLRSKMKRKVDTRATKGRKLRFTVHNKLVNFMAPIPNYTHWTEDAESELFKSLFGKTEPVN